VNSRAEALGLLEAAHRRDIDVVLVWRLDRWDRSLLDPVSTGTDFFHLADITYIRLQNEFVYLAVVTAALFGDEPIPNGSAARNRTRTSSGRNTLRICAQSALARRRHFPVFGQEGSPAFCSRGDASTTQRRNEVWRGILHPRPLSSPYERLKGLLADLPFQLCDPALFLPLTPIPQKGFFSVFAHFRPPVP
jgi:hypothetical protein